MITKYPPNTVWLGGKRTVVNDIPCSETMTPGMLIERFNSSGAVKFRKHSGAGLAGSIVVTERTMINESVDATIPAGDLIEAMVCHPGTTAWMFIASGANIAAGDKLSSAGNGKLQPVASGIATFIALENKNNSSGPGDARIRVEAV